MHQIDGDPGYFLENGEHVPGPEVEGKGHGIEGDKTYRRVGVTFQLDNEKMWEHGSQSGECAQCGMRENEETSGPVQ